jgi:hypothetical protein
MQRDALAGVATPCRPRSLGMRPSAFLRVLRALGALGGSSSLDGERDSQAIATRLFPTPFMKNGCATVSHPGPQTLYLRRTAEWPIFLHKNWKFKSNLLTQHWATSILKRVSPCGGLGWRHAAIGPNRRRVAPRPANEARVIQT